MKASNFENKLWRKKGPLIQGALNNVIQEQAQVCHHFSILYDFGQNLFFLSNLDKNLFTLFLKIETVGRRYQVKTSELESSPMLYISRYLGTCGWYICMQVRLRGIGHFPIDMVTNRAHQTQQYICTLIRQHFEYILSNEQIESY